jgi:ABC-type transport system involved in cytochrome c biogenesis permease subunit
MVPDLFAMNPHVGMVCALYAPICLGLLIMDANLFYRVKDFRNKLVIHDLKPTRDGGTCLR